MTFKEIKNDLAIDLASAYMDFLKSYKAIIVKCKWCEQMKVDGTFVLADKEFNHLGKEYRTFQLRASELGIELYYKGDNFEANQRCFTFKEIPNKTELKSILIQRLKPCLEI